MCVLLVCFTQRKELMKIIRTDKHAPIGYGLTFCSRSETPVWPCRADSAGERTVEAAIDSSITKTSIGNLRSTHPQIVCGSGIDSCLVRRLIDLRLTDYSGHLITLADFE